MEKLIIIGSGPAGHTAAIYAARANLSPLMFEWFLAGGVAAGGQLTTTTTVENFPWFPTGIEWPELMERMRSQSEHNGTRILTQTVDKIDVSSLPYKVFSEGKEYTTNAIIITTWATAKKLEVPGSKEYRMKGISWCAICDWALPIFRDKIIVVVGGGDVAMEEATHMSHFWSKVILLVRRSKAEMRASKAMQQRVFSNPKIEVLEYTELQEVMWDWKIITTIKVINNQTWVVSEISVWGLFFAIWHTPNTGFLWGQIELDDAGYIITKAGTTHTSKSWIFAAGDVQDKKYRQAVTSAGTWCMAALEAEQWLQTLL